MHSWKYSKLSDYNWWRFSRSWRDYSKGNETFLHFKFNIEGSLIKIILSKRQSAKEIEFRECNICKLDSSFKLEKSSYHIEKQIFNRCHYNSSFKHMKPCLTNLIIAMSKWRYKKSLKTLKLKVTEDTDSEQDVILDM